MSERIVMPVPVATRLLTASTESVWKIVSDALGVSFDQIEIAHGDTDRVPYGIGTYGARSIAVGRLGDEALDRDIAGPAALVSAVLHALESRQSTCR